MRPVAFDVVLVMALPSRPEYHPAGCGLAV